jgi:hypothetical protein
MKKKKVCNVSDEAFVKSIKYGLVVVRQSKDDKNCIDLLHFCGFAKKPKKADIESLRKECKEDKEFGLADVIDECDIIEAPKDLVKFYLEKAK